MVKKLANSFLKKWEKNNMAKSYKLLIIFIFILFFAQLPGCIFVRPNANDLEVFNNSEREIQTELFFGLSKPDGTNVTEEEWNKFVGDYIAPRFEDGFTVVDARGQWLDNNNKIVKENTKLVILIYKRSHDLDSSINNLIDNYKRLFHQEFVLRVTVPALVED